MTSNGVVGRQQGAIGLSHFAGKTEISAALAT